VCLARGWTARLRLVPQWWVLAMGVGRWLVAGVAGSMEVAHAVVVAGYRGALPRVSGPLRWLRERRLLELLVRRALLRLPGLPGMPG
jgi:hypothetical protein